jgi:hypothetical protein
MTVTP